MEGYYDVSMIWTDLDAAGGGARAPLRHLDRGVAIGLEDEIAAEPLGRLSERAVGVHRRVVDDPDGRGGLRVVQRVGGDEDPELAALLVERHHLAEHLGPFGRPRLRPLTLVQQQHESHAV